MASQRPFLVFADLLKMCGPGSTEPGSGPDQAERVFLREFASRLRRRVPTLVYSTSKEEGYDVHEVPGHPLISPQLLREVWRHRPQAIIYVYPVTTAALLRARLLKLAGRGVSVILMALASHRLEALGRLVGRWAWPDVVLVSSEAERRKLAAAGAPVHSISMGVDLARFRPPEPEEKPQLRRQWGLPLDDAIVLHVGHLLPARNLQVLAAVAAKPKTTAVVLVSHVKDPDSDRLKEHLRRNGVVLLDGYRPDVEELYRAADCYIFPARAWGGGIEMPLSVLEAMATDLPVASTYFGALPERFSAAEGIRFAAGDEELLQTVVTLLLVRPHTRHLVESSSWEVLVDRLLGLLSRLPKSISLPAAPAAE